MNLNSLAKIHTSINYIKKLCLFESVCTQILNAFLIQYIIDPSNVSCVSLSQCTVNFFCCLHGHINTDKCANNNTSEYTSAVRVYNQPSSRDNGILSFLAKRLRVIKKLLQRHNMAIVMITKYDL